MTLHVGTLAFAQAPRPPQSIWTSYAGSTPSASPLGWLFPVGTDPHPGDLMVAYLYAPFVSAGSWTFPAGWTVSTNGGGAPSGVVGIAWKIAGASEPTSYNMQWSGSSGDVANNIMIGIRGSSGIDGSILDNSGFGTTMSVPSQTPTSRSDMLLAVYLNHSGDTISPDPAGLTLITEQSQSGTGGAATLYAYYADLVGLAPTGTYPTETHSIAVNYWFAYSLLAKP